MLLNIKLYPVLMKIPNKIKFKYEINHNPDFTVVGKNSGKYNGGKYNRGKTMEGNNSLQNYYIHKYRQYKIYIL